MTGSDPFAVRALLGPDAALCHRAVTGEHGVSLPPLHDHHVHSHLAEIDELPAAGIAAVLDLGGDPVLLARRPKGHMPIMAYAGAFLTAEGGYPSTRAWAPAAIVRELRGHPGLGTPGDAETAVDEQAGFGAAVIKVALNATAGPVLDADTLTSVVAAAHARGLPVIAHVEGDGMTARAAAAGVDALAHTPFTEALDDATLAACAGMVWISTLAIHDADGPDLARATANAAAFIGSGGHLLYGTDLGNGDRRPGIDAKELARLQEVGLRDAALLAALTDPWPHPSAPHGVATFVSGPPPADSAGIPEWLARAVVVPREELVLDD